MQPQISVVIPVFNGERYLDEAIASVVAQDYAPLEITVVDDGSTDGSVALVRDRWPAVTVVEQGHSGPAAARNLGAEFSTGDVLAFLDADDLWLPGKLKRQTEALDREQGFDCVFGAVRQFLSPEIDPSELAAVVTDSSMPGYVPGAMLVRRAAFWRAGGFATDVPVGELIPWLARARALGLKILVEADEVLLRRVHRTNMTSTAQQDHRGYLKAVRIAREIARAD
jgi:glycosyltransferase involved in cell wall biosynthesis